MPTKRDLIAEDATAQRLLNLAFIFNTTTRPLTTDEIISDTDLGYGSGNRESDVRKFRRDRQKLAEQGFEIVCADGDGTAENEASSWVLDRARTFATAGIITNDDASILADAIDEYLSASLTPLRAPLMRARAKILELVRAGDAPQQQAAGGPAAQDGAEQTMLDIVWLAFSLRRALTFSYTNGHGGHSRRSVAIYGIFSHEGATYIVGFDDAAQAVRTFRVDRMERALRPGKRYEIPASFDIHAYLFLPSTSATVRPSRHRSACPARTCRKTSCPSPMDGARSRARRTARSCGRSPSATSMPPRRSRSAMRATACGRWRPWSSSRGGTP